MKPIELVSQILQGDADAGVDYTFAESRHSKKDVAAHLVISHRTADHHVRHIYEKIGVLTCAGATPFALEHRPL